MKRKRTKKTISAILILTMLTTIFPFNAFAAVQEESISDSASEMVNAFDTEVIFVEDAYVNASEKNNTGIVRAAETPEIFSNLSGRVVDENGNGVSDVSVMLYNYDERTAELIYVTDSLGNWITDNYDIITGYTYEIRYYKSGYEFEKNYIITMATAEGTTIETVTAAPAADGVCNTEDYTYSVVNGEAVITGYTGNDSSIILPSQLGGYPVTAIGSYAFYDYANLETIYLSNEIKTIEEQAFEGCSGLKNIYFPNTLSEIRSYAFSNCTSLETVEFTKAIITIGSYQ